MNWYKIFISREQAEEQLPLNETVRVVIGSLEICLAHTKEGFFAVQNSCSHLGESLSKGRINYLGEVICPWHSYRFNLRTGQETSGNDCKDLRTYPIEWREEGLFIGIPF